MGLMGLLGWRGFIAFLGSVAWRVESSGCIGDQKPGAVPSLPACTALLGLRVCVLRRDNTGDVSGKWRCHEAL